MRTGLVGAPTVMDLSELVTLKVRLLEVMPVREAPMFVEPTARAVAMPAELIVAMAVLEELQTTCDVMLAVELSL